MEQIGQNLAVGAALFVLLSLVLRRIPLIGMLWRLVTRLTLLLSPVGIAAILALLVWYHGSDRATGNISAGVAAPVEAEPVQTGPIPPLPPERPQ